MDRYYRIHRVCHIEVFQLKFAEGLGNYLVTLSAKIFVQFYFGEYPFKIKITIFHYYSWD